MTGSIPTSMSASSVLPAPAFDHVVVNARDRLDDAASCYRRLGFALTPLGRHTLGSINHLAVLADDYLELVGIDPTAATARRELMDHAAGLNGLVFATDDADGLYRALAAAGAPVERPAEFSRPVSFAGGSADARFRVVRVAAGATPYGRVYFCQHLTRDLVWRAEWRAHPNGAVGVARAVLAAADPEAVGALYRLLFPAHPPRPIADGLSLGLGPARLDILTPAAVAREFGSAAPDPQGRSQYLAALAIRTRDLHLARAALGAHARSDGARILVAAADAFGLALEFVG